MTTSKLFSISLLTWFVGVIVIAFFSTGAAMIFTIAGLIPVCLVVELVRYIPGLQSHYKVIAKNRHGHITVFVTQKPGIYALVLLCIKAIYYYRWVNLTITKI